MSIPSPEIMTPIERHLTLVADVETPDIRALLDDPNTNNILTAFAYLTPQFEAYQRVADDWRDDYLKRRGPLTTTDSEVLFMADARSHKLLTKDDEQTLAKLIEVGKHAETLLNAQGVLTDEEREQLAQAIAIGQTARHELILTNLRLVADIAMKRYAGKGVDFLDLVEEGVIGMHKGINKFDWRFNVKFSTHITTWVRQAMLRTVRQPRSMHVPDEKLIDHRSIQNTQERLTGELKRHPSQAEVAGDLDMTVDELRDIEGIVKAGTARSLDAPKSKYVKGEPAHNALVDNVVDRTQGGDEERMARLVVIRELVRLCLSGVDDKRQQKIVVERFGLNGEPPKTLEEIAQEYNVTRERIRQLQDKALRKFQQLARANGYDLSELLDE